MKKHSQLGINPSTASQRLVKDLLFKFVSDAGHVCHQCGGSLTRGDFSVEHKTPWLDSDDPVGLFFDLGNVAYSHRSCNASAARRPHKKYFTDEARREAQIRWQREHRLRNSGR
jgi:hypothetical protein